MGHSIFSPQVWKALLSLRNHLILIGHFSLHFFALLPRDLHSSSYHLTWSDYIKKNKTLRQVTIILKCTRICLVVQLLRDHPSPTQAVIFNETFRDFCSKTYINQLTNSGHSILGWVLCLSIKLEHHRILSGELGARVSPRELTELCRLQTDVVMMSTLLRKINIAKLMCRPVKKWFEQ